MTSLSACKNFTNLSIYSWHKVGFRVPGPKKSHPYLTMSMPIVTLGFPDTYEDAKNQLNSFIGSWDKADYRVSMTIKATLIFDHAHPITIKITFNFPEYVLSIMQKIS